jgi:hypothetical protein
MFDAMKNMVKLWEIQVNQFPYILPILPIIYLDNVFDKPSENFFKSSLRNHEGSDTKAKAFKGFKIKI